ncbi:uncharacterized protein TNCV_5039541 [Trichonephila clavipes]|nr:uncharacterized protein TNCV_5039541 [Trichonephila clavipes]
MKFLLLAALVVLVVVEVTAPPPPPPPSGRPPPPPPSGRPPRPPPPPKGKKCSTSEDCDDGECCIDRGPFRKGRCNKLATEGRRCNLEGELFHDKYVRNCPCAEGLTCQAEKTKETPWGEVRINERCVSPSSTTAEPEPETEAPEPEAEG